MTGQEKTLVWIGSSKKDLLALPREVMKFFGHALDFAQRGDRHSAAKPLKETPKEDMDIIRDRLNQAEARARELRHGQTRG